MYSSLVKKILIISLFTIPYSLFAQDTAGIEEVVVTAEKREQNLQDVPSSITVLSGSEMDRDNFQNLMDLQASIPSVVVGSAGASRPFLFIRGIGSRKFDPGTEGAVGVFVDEVYNTRFTNSMMDIVDLERVEVLKGPQGTLYGRNTIGGAIALYTKKPSSELEAKIKVGFGNDGYQKVAGSFSGGLSNSLVGRLTFSSKTDDGNAVQTSTGINNGADNDAIRLSLIKDFDDGSELSLTLQDTSYSTDAHLAEAQLECGPTIDPNGSPNFMSAAFFTVSRAAGAAGVAQLTGAGLGPNDCYSTGPPLPFFPFGPFAGQPNVGVLPLIGSDAFINSVRADMNDGPKKIDNDHTGFNEIDSTMATLKYITDINDNLSLTAIYSTTDVDNASSLDFDATSINSIVNYVNEESEQSSTEIRLNYEGDNFYWVGGLYLLDDEIYRRDNFTTDIQSLVGFVQLGMLMNGITPVASNNIQTSYSDVTSQALYWQGTIELNDKLNATFGVRKSDDESDYRMVMETTSPGVPFVQVPDEWTEVLKFGSTDPKFVLDYTFNENSMGYMSVSSGYKSGGFSYASWARADSLGGFDEEDLKSTEIGYKYKSSDNKLLINTAYYEYDYTNQQQQIIVVNSSGALAGQTFNAGSSDMTGFELETKYAVTDNVLIDFSYYSAETEFKSFELTDTRPPLSFTGNKMNYSPESSYNVGLTIYPDDDSSVFTMSYSKKDSYFMDPSNRFVSEQPAYGLLNMSYIKDFNDNLQMKIFCTNCTDEIYLTQVTTFAVQFGGGGRNYYANGKRVGLEVTYSF
jgi:iron complex outermembrane receptor protein